MSLRMQLLLLQVVIVLATVSATGVASMLLQERQLRDGYQDRMVAVAQSTARLPSIVDAFRQPYIPFYLTTRQFFALVKSRLAPGGSVIVNVGHPSDSDALEKAMTATMGAVFAHVMRDPIASTNSLVIASDRQLSAVGMLDVPAPLIDLAQAQPLVPGLHGGSVFTDDRAPVEWLIDASIVKYAAEDAG